MSESERETTSEKKPVVEQKAENFIEAAWRWVKTLDSPSKFLLTMMGLAGFESALGHALP
jgi:hypothetical protein